MDKITSVNFDVLDNLEIASIDRWCGWYGIWQEQKGRYNKPPININKIVNNFTPFNPNEPKNSPNNIKFYSQCAKSNDISTMCSYGLAREMLQKYNYQRFQGLNYLCGEGIIGIDLDNCIDENNRINDFAKKIIAELDSYTEVSPSRKGIHILVKCDLPVSTINNDKYGIEIKSDGSTLSITGRAFENHKTIENRTAKLLEIYEQYKPQAKLTANKPKIEYNKNIYISDNEIIAKLSKSERTRDLWTGNGKYGESENDIKLCGAILFYTQGDQDRAKAIFEQSPHYQCKDKDHIYKWHNSSYACCTLDKAARTLTMYYDPNYNKKDNMQPRDKRYILINKLTQSVVPENIGKVTLTVMNNGKREFMRIEKNKSLPSKYAVMNLLSNYQYFANLHDIKLDKINTYSNIQLNQDDWKDIKEKCDFINVVNQKKTINNETQKDITQPQAVEENADNLTL